ncbi:hypothetical protein DYI37_16185 [Fulvimarina endophytica]|uniref:PRC-barrel domain-containing protein n=1 Tax=Fulvimarina endophytica TaxID=2293836 RepID=A0A371WZF4_9HYPH|nr:PRC-barrel domain-containing protein [Fulvimarina endophytica]RFC62368.1 hypothetical protein DYI37_16185 [Fulvimarina endophytica]
MLKRTGTAFAATLLLAGTAFAQTAMTEVTDDVTVAPLNMTVDQIDDMDVYDASGTKVGEVDDVLGSDAQTPTHLEVSFDDDDGSTYPDRDDVLVPLSDFSVTNDQLTVGVSAEDVQTLPTRND